MTLLRINFTLIKNFKYEKIRKKVLTEMLQQTRKCFISIKKEQGLSNNDTRCCPAVKSLSPQTDRAHK